MSYAPHNKRRQAGYIAEVYQREKQHDIPDTRIVRNIFPKYGIFISYRTWMNIKNMKHRDLPVPKQLTIF